MVPNNIYLSPTTDFHIQKRKQSQWIRKITRGSQRKHFTHRLVEILKEKEPGDKEGAPAGREIGVSGDRRVLWECRSRNPWDFESFLFAEKKRD